MSSYKFDRDALSKLFESIQDQYSKWSDDDLDVLESRINSFLGSTNISGSAADNIKDYFKYVHLSLIGFLNELIYLHYSGFSVYLNNYTNIEGEDHAIIDEMELYGCQQKLEGSVKKALDIHAELNVALNSVSDIISIPHKSVYDVESTHNEGIEYLKKVDGDIRTHENWHQFNDFNNSKPLIDSIDKFITLYLTHTRKPISEFNVENFLSSDCYIELASLGKVIGDYLEEHKDLISNSINNNNQYVVKLKEEERKKREEEAKFWTTVVAVGCAVIGTVIAVCVPGAGTVAGAAIIGAAIGVINGAADAIATQYIESGQFVTDPWAVVGSAVKGGLVGVATGAVGGLGVGAAVAKPITSVISSPVAKRAAGGIVENVVEGAAGRYTEGYVGTTIDNIGEVGGSLISGKTLNPDAIKDPYYEGLKKATDLDEAQKDIFKGSVKAGPKEVGRIKADDGRYDDRIDKGIDTGWDIGEKIFNGDKPNEEKNRTIGGGFGSGGGGESR